MIKPIEYEREALRDAFRDATPFPHVSMDPFLPEATADELAGAFPSFEQASEVGKQFTAVNEMRKIQITDPSAFSGPIAELNDFLASPEYLKELEFITGIPNLLADPSLAGGGIHMTGSRGRLDVHVDFNYLEEANLYRRLNLLLYLNPVWERSWGGAVELWDEKVSTRHHSFEPKLNRCVLFETSQRSYHGVEEVRCPPEMTRNSFAVYYYTKEPPPDYPGYNHTTRFRARPDEPLKKYVLMPAEKAKLAVQKGREKAERAKNKVKKLLGR